MNFENSGIGSYTILLLTDKTLSREYIKETILGAALTHFAVEAEGVAGLEDCHISNHVCCAAAMGLDVDMVIGVECLLPLLLAVGFKLVNMNTAAVVALAGIALAVLVGKAGADSLHDVLADEVFACDKLNKGILSVLFFFNDFKDFTHFCTPLYNIL